jgi:hypothetical protein
MPDTAVFDGTLVDTNYQHALAWLVTSLSPTSTIRARPSSSA